MRDAAWGGRHVSAATAQRLFSSTAFGLRSEMPGLVHLSGFAVHKTRSGGATQSRVVSSTTIAAWFNSAKGTAERLRAMGGLV